MGADWRRYAARGGPAAPRAALACLLFAAAAGATGGLVHSHHHLLGQGGGDGGQRQGYLEVDQHARAQLSAGGGPPACDATRHPLEEAVLAGSRKAYAFGGIPDDCGPGYGCQSGYWSKWCRWQHDGPPQCPQAVQDELQARLRRAAGEGHAWARDILLVRPCEIFPYLEGRTLWIIGDSMSKDFAFAFQCFMLEYWDLADAGRWPQNQSLSPNVSDSPQLMREVFQALGRNDPQLEAEPWFLQWCVPMYGSTRACFLRANDGTTVAESILPLLPRLASPDDVALVNFGLHSNDDGSLAGYIKELNAFAARYKQLRARLPQLLWRQTSVQHFSTLLGEWSDKLPMAEQRCTAIRGLQLQPDGTLAPDGDPALDGALASDQTDARDTLMRGGRRNVRSDAIMGKLGVPILQIWNQTLPFWDFHKHYHDPNGGGACSKIDCDCTHICFPSWHQMWMASLQKVLAKVGRKGAPRLEEWAPPMDYPVPGINVPQDFNPAKHWKKPGTGIFSR